MNLWRDLAELRRIGKKKETGKLDVKTLVQVFKTFGRHYKDYWQILTFAYLCLFATIGLGALAPIPLKLILDQVILKKPLPDSLSILAPVFTLPPRQLILILALSVVAMAMLSAFVSYFNKFYISSTGDKILADIRERIFAHLQRLSLSFHESSRAGNLIYLLTSDLSKLKTILIDFPQDLTHRLGTIALYAGLLLALNWRLALVGISALPVVYMITQFFGPGLRAAMKRRRKREGNVASMVSENVLRIALIQAYGQQEAAKQKFNVENQKSVDAQLSALSLERTYSRLVDFFIILVTAVVLYLGGRDALNGVLLPGTLVLITIYMRELYGPIEKLNRLFIDLVRAQVSGELLLEVVENEMVQRDAPHAVPAPPLRGEIEFCDVCFSYRRGTEVLKNINFHVRPGQTVAIIGHSGAGKSTLISLLLRFYNPRSGQILLDGRDIRDYTMRSIRDQITVLLQDAKLFQQTVRENIAFGRPDATEEEIIAAAKQAEAHEFIMQLPKGYDTIMYEGGDNLSGGQKQRINIARAIIRNTPLVILDEPASGLDARVEAKIHQAIRSLTKGKTTFIVAHKLQTIVHADKILLLEGGELVGQGTHNELLQGNSTYQALSKAQFDWQETISQKAVSATGNNGNMQAAEKS